MVNIIEIKNKLGNGCTIPFVVWCDDKQTYVVKFPGNIQGFKSLVNEFIASNLCEYLELPIFPHSLVKVKLSDYNDKTKGEIEPLEGTAFGTVYNDNALTILNSRMISESANKHDAIKILIFDILIGNCDRNKGNLMIDSLTKKLFMIDHTHIFQLGTIWDVNQLPRFFYKKFDTDVLHPFNYNNIIESLKIDAAFYEELNDFVKIVKTISKEFIQNIMDRIPPDWMVSEEEKKVLCDYIYYRFQRVDEVVELLNIRGGDKNEV